MGFQEATAWAQAADLILCLGQGPSFEWPASMTSGVLTVAFPWLFYTFFRCYTQLELKDEEWRPDPGMLRKAVALKKRVMGGLECLMAASGLVSVASKAQEAKRGPLMLTSLEEGTCLFPVAIARKSPTSEGQLDKV